MGEPDGLVQAAAPLPTVEPTAVLDYLTDYLQRSFQTTKEDLEASGSFLHKSKYSETLQRATRFISEPQGALYVSVDTVPDDKPRENGILNETTGEADAKIEGDNDETGMDLRYIRCFFVILDIRVLLD